MLKSDPPCATANTIRQRSAHLLRSSIRGEPLLKLLTLVRAESQSSACIAHDPNITDSKIIV